MAQPPTSGSIAVNTMRFSKLFVPKMEFRAGRLVGITTALRGGGGFGKTALAQKLCFDERVQETYPDGILWTTMGEDISESGRLSNSGSHSLVDR